LANVEGGTPSDFTASFGSTSLMSLVDTTAQPYTEYTFYVTGSGSPTDLHFAGTQLPAAWFLDDISVIDPPVPSQDMPLVETGTVLSTFTNSGALAVGDGSFIALSGVVDNTGSIAINAQNAATGVIVNGEAVFEGRGIVSLSDNSLNSITGSGLLSNIDNTFVGSGDIGDGSLSLVNKAGLIEATGVNPLIIDTGTNNVFNSGTLEAHGGTLIVESPVTGDGSAIIADGTLIFDTQSDASVTFDNGTGTPVYGELVLGNASGFSGQISGFTGTAPDTAHSDAIDLKDISFGSNITFAYNDNAGTDTGGTLTIFESGGVVDSIKFATGEFTTANFTLSSDGSGGTLITDPPTSTTTAGATTTLASDSAVTVAGGSNGNNIIAGGDTMIGGGQANQTLTGNGNNDTFVFAPGFGHDTITNFQPATGVLQIDHSVFANVQAILAATQGDGHGNAVITADLHDSITLQHVTVAQLQAHHSDFHII
jgi:hypothetical protein